MSRRGLYALFPDARDKSGLFVNYIEEVKDHVKGSLLIVSLRYSCVAQYTLEVLSGRRRLSVLRVAYTWNRHLYLQ